MINTGEIGLQQIGVGALSGGPDLRCRLRSRRILHFPDSIEFDEVRLD